MVASPGLRMGERRPAETARADVAWLVGLALVLSASFLWTTWTRDARVGMGPDVPVYLWWGRAASSLGVGTVPVAFT